MPYRADVTEPDPKLNIVSKYLSEPSPSGPDRLGSGIHPLIHSSKRGSGNLSHGCVAVGASLKWPICVTSWGVL